MTDKQMIALLRAWDGKPNRELDLALLNWHAASKYREFNEWGMKYVSSTLADILGGPNEIARLDVSQVPTIKIEPGEETDPYQIEKEYHFLDYISQALKIPEVIRVPNYTSDEGFLFRTIRELVPPETKLIMVSDPADEYYFDITYKRDGYWHQARNIALHSVGNNLIHAGWKALVVFRMTMKSEDEKRKTP